jgi:hypothetical protein
MSAEPPLATIEFDEIAIGAVELDRDAHRQVHVHIDDDVGVGITSGMLSKTISLTASPGPRRRPWTGLGPGQITIEWPE